MSDQTGSNIDAATRALWRVAESGEVDELATVLPRVQNINACNEHGVTALMRAAQQGHLRMVLALLDHGADANIRRNDKFTALALAAFFGHTEIVRTLMEHGADSKAATRGDTSPRMWATARTFGEIANQIERGATTKQMMEPVKPVPVAPAMAKSPVAIKTLKDPPEIWDLVHAVPKGFNARSAFISRVESMKTSWPLRMAAAIVLIAGCAVGVLVLRSVQARNERSSELPHTEVSNPGPASNVSNASAASITDSPTSPAPAPVTTVNDAGSNNPVATTRTNLGVRQQHSPIRLRATPMPRVSAKETVPIVIPSTEQRVAPATPELHPKAKANTSLSPQLIAPPKNSALKAKVIQWP